VVRRALVPFVALGAVLLAFTACATQQDERDWARVSVLTCASTIARAGLPAPDPAWLSPERFIAERRSLIASGRRFNTVTPFRNVCTAVRKQVVAVTTTVPGPVIDGSTDAQEPDTTDTGT
jgi:hypothetical protein